MKWLRLSYQTITVCFLCRNSVSMLASYCHSKGMPEPQYHGQTGSDGRFRFIVYLQGGVKFVGSWAKQRDQAAESAASVTIYHLVCLILFI